MFIVASAVLAVPATADAAFWNKWFKKGKADTTEVAEQDPEKVQESGKIMYNATGESHGMMNNSFFSFMRIHSLIIFLVAGRFRIYSSLSGHCVAFQIFVVRGDLVDYASVRKNLNDAVCRSLNNLMVTG